MPRVLVLGGSGKLGNALRSELEARRRDFASPTRNALDLLTEGAAAAWIERDRPSMVLNASGVTHFDLYPFILLNLAFSLQAAYAAPLILLAQTRQADRDKAHADADAQHREALAEANIERQELGAKQSTELLQLLEQNTHLTQATQELTRRIKELTDEIHRRVTVT